MIDTSGSAGSGGSGGNDISLAGYATEAFVEENYLSKEFFLRLFGIHGTDENDDPVDVEPNDPDTTITDIEAKYGFWSDSFVSAFGLGEGGGGGGTLTLNEPLNRINTDLNNANPTTANRTLVWNGSKWTYRALTDGSVTSVGMSVPTGFAVTGSPITSSGTLALSFATGYSLPLTADVEKGVTAYGWGNHANAGYALASNVYSKADADGRFLTISFFRSLFKAYQSDNTTEVVPNNGDTSLISSIKAMFGLWTEQYLSAFGLGTSGGGTVSLCEPLNNINNNINQNPAVNGATFVWNGNTSKFVYSNANGQKLYVGSGGLEIGNSGNLTVSGSATVTGNVEVNGGGFVKSDSSNDYVLLAGGGTAKLSDIGGGSYLPLTGGKLSLSTLSGFVVDRASNANSFVTFKGNVSDNAGTLLGYLGFSDINTPAFRTTGGTNRTLWHSGNFTPSDYVPTTALDTALSSYALSANVYSKTDVNGFTWWGASLSNGAVSGDMTNVGDITLSKGAGNRQLSITKGGSVSIAASTSTWACSYNAKTKDGSSNLGAYGFYGSGDTLTRMYIGTSYTGTWISILPSGNVGIGVDSPTSKLHVDGTFNVTGNSTIGGTFEVTGAATLSSALSVSGATTLSSTLTVAGTTKLQGNVYISNNKYIYYRDKDDTDYKDVFRLNGSNRLIIGYGIRTLSDSYTSIYAGASGMKFFTNGTTERMIITASGLVGIGSTDETNFITEKLSVKGNIRTNDSDGAYIQIGGARIVWDNTNKALKVIQSDNSTAANLYATGAVSAFGIGSSASGLSLCAPLNNINTNILSNPTVDGATFVWNGNTSKFVYSSASGQTLRAYTMYVDAGGLTVGNSGNLTVGGAATVTGAMTVENGNIVVTSGSAAIGTTVSNSYKLRVNGATFMKELYLSSSTSSSPTNRLRLYYNSGFYLSTGSTDITYRNLTVTVGTASPYIDKSWIVTSDMRLKTIVSNAGASIEQIADAPIFNYKTQDGGSDVMLGTSAQYWQTIFPCAVKDAPNGYLAQDYPATALAAAVITARKVVDHEQRIRQLEIENEELKKELKQLKAA